MHASATTLPGPTPAAARDAMVALVRAVEALRLYGPSHAVTDAACAALAQASHDCGFARVTIQGLEWNDGLTARDPGAATFAAALARANIAMIGLFGPLSVDAARGAAHALHHLLTSRGSPKPHIEAIAHATSGALRLLPLSTAGLHLSDATGHPGGLDWTSAIDRVLDAMNRQLDSLQTQAGAPSQHPLGLEHIAQALAAVPAEHRPRAQAHVRKFFDDLPQNVRRNILDLEPGHSSSHFDALGLLAEALPVEDIARAVGNAAAGGKSLSPHTVRFFSRLIAASREDAAKTNALRQVVRQWRTSLEAGVGHDPALRSAMENLLRDVDTAPWLPATHEDTIAHIHDPAPAAPTPPTPACPTSIAWEPLLDHAFDIARALSDPHAGRQPEIRFLLARAEALVDAGHLDQLLIAALDTGHDAAQLRTILSQPPSLRALAHHAHLPAAARLVATLGPDAGATSLALAALEPDARQGLIQLARAAGPWADIALLAAAREAGGLTTLCHPQAGLSVSERDHLIGAMLHAPNPAARDEALSLARSSDDPWPVPVIDFALHSPAPALRLEAIAHLAQGITPAGLPVLAEFLCDLSHPAWRGRDAGPAAIAALAYGSPGAVALAHAAQRLKRIGGPRAWCRLFILADALRLCQGVPEVDRALGGSFTRLRWCARVWAALALLGGGNP